MIKKSIIILIILLLFLPVMSAVEFDMKINFSQGETLMARVSGYFLEPILKENIFFYRGHVRTPMEYDVAKIGEEFYIYALLSEKNPNNYSIVIKNIRYMKGSQVSEEELAKNFSITENTADFSINPGFVVAKDNFFIEVQNLQDYKITIQIRTLIKNATSEPKGFLDSLFGGGEDEEESERDPVTLMSGEIKKINFELMNITEPTFRTIELSTENLKYEIPVYIFVEAIPEEKEKGFKFEPSELNVSTSTNFNTTRIIYLYNTGQETLGNISLSISNSLKSYINLSIEQIEELEEESNIKIEFYIFSKEEGKVEGHIKAKTEDETLLTYSAISLNFLKDYVPSDEDDEILITKPCSEWNGIICGSDEECSISTIETLDELECCLGTCKKIEESSTGRIIGWIIFILVAGFLIWFFKKRYKGAKKPIDLLKIAKGKKK